MGSWQERVKTLVKKTGGMEALAVKLKVSYYTIVRWRAGTNEPSRLAKLQIEQLEKGK